MLIAAAHCPTALAQSEADSGPVAEDINLTYVTRIIGLVGLRNLPGNLEHNKLFFLTNLHGKRYYIGPPGDVPSKLGKFLEEAWESQKAVALSGHIAELHSGTSWLLAKEKIAFDPAPGWYGEKNERLMKLRGQKEKKREAKMAKTRGTLMPGSKPLGNAKVKELQEMFSKAAKPSKRD